MPPGDRSRPAHRVESTGVVPEPSNLALFAVAAVILLVTPDTAASGNRR
jgi:hypothetical protein